MRATVPKWVLAYALLMTILPLGISAVIANDPGTLFPTLRPVEGALALSGPLGMYLSRNLAGGVVMGYALFERSGPMLQLAFVMRLVTDVLDFVFMYALTGQWIPFLFIWIAMFWLPCALGWRAVRVGRE